MIETEKKINRILTQKLGVNEQKVTPNANIINDLGADSLDQVEVVMDLEDEFDIEIPDEDLDNFKTVQDIYDYIQKKML